VKWAVEDKESFQPVFVLSPCELTYSRRAR
jgi:hypothetical protein